MRKSTETKFPTRRKRIMGYRRHYRMPNGEITEDVDEYANTWKALGEPLAKHMGWSIQGVDPGMSFLTKDARPRIVNVDLDIIEAFNKLLKGVQHDSRQRASVST